VGGDKSGQIRTNPDSLDGPAKMKNAGSLSQGRGVPKSGQSVPDASDARAIRRSSDVFYRPDEGRGHEGRGGLVRKLVENLVEDLLAVSNSVEDSLSTADSEHEELGTSHPEGFRGAP
jgi:hypothetical protein